METPKYIQDLTNLSKAFLALTPKEREVFILRRFSGKISKLEEVGKKMRISKQRVKQLEANGLEKIRLIYFTFQNDEI